MYFFFVSVLFYYNLQEPKKWDNQADRLPLGHRGRVQCLDRPCQAGSVSKKWKGIVVASSSQLVHHTKTSFEGHYHCITLILLVQIPIIDKKIRKSMILILNCYFTALVHSSSVLLSNVTPFKYFSCIQNWCVLICNKLIG